MESRSESRSQTQGELLERFGTLMNAVQRFFESLGVEARCEIVSGSDLRSFFVEARSDLHDVDVRFFMFRLVDENLSKTIAEYISSGHARTIIPIVLDKHGNVICGYTILTLVREYRPMLDTALFTVYRTNLDMGNDVDFVKAVLLWLLVDYLALSKYVAPYVYNIDGEEVRLGLEHFATLLVLYVRAHIGDKVLNELPPEARVLAFDMFEKVLSDENVQKRISDLVKILRVLKHGRYIPALSFLTRLEPLLTFIQKRTEVEAGRLIPKERLVEAVQEAKKQTAEPAIVEEERQDIEKEIEVIPEVELEKFEEKTIELAREVEEIGKAEERVPEVWTGCRDGVPVLYVKCPNCGETYCERLRLGDRNLEFRCSKCGFHCEIPSRVIQDKARLFVQSGVKARLEVVDVTPEGIRGTCPLCGYEIITDETMFVNCPKCGLGLEIPADAFDKLLRVRSESPLVGSVVAFDASRIVVKCPYCGHENVYTRTEQIVEGCRATCKSCGFIFKIPEDICTTWIRSRRELEDAVRELERCLEAGSADDVGSVALRLSIDVANADITARVITDVLGNFEKVRIFVSRICDTIEKLVNEAHELKLKGLEEEAREKLAKARKLYSVVEAIVQKYGRAEFARDYDRVLVLLDPEKYIEDRLRSEVGEAYTRYGKEISALSRAIEDVVKKLSERLPPSEVARVRKFLYDAVVTCFARLNSVLFGTRDVFGTRQELEQSRATLPEVLEGILRVVIRRGVDDVDAMISAVSKIVNYVPTVVPIPEMLRTGIAQLHNDLVRKGYNMPKGAIILASLYVGYAFVTRLDPQDIEKILLMLDPAYGPDSVVAYVMYRLLHGYRNVDDVVMRYMKVPSEKAQYARELAEA